MFRKELPENQGMLFIFKTEGQYSFWMKNTGIPLSIAFIDKNKKIISIQEMAPFDETNHHAPPRPVKYALEMNAGWFKKRGIITEDKVEFNANEYSN